MKERATKHSEEFLEAPTDVHNRASTCNSGLVESERLAR